MPNVNVYDFADTWNNGATTFTAIKMNVTDTASNAASLLMDLQVGSTSKLNFGKSGPLKVVGGIWTGSNVLGSRTVDLVSYSQQISMANGVNLAWESSATITGAPDLKLFRDEANTLAQRNGTNAQAFRVYGTYTNASNYEFGYLAASASGFDIGTTALGTGVKRPVRILGQSLASAEAVSLLEMAQTWNTTGTPTALKLNVTDTASNAASLLMDLQVGGVSQINVSKTGLTTIRGNAGNILMGANYNGIAIGNTAVGYRSGGVAALTFEFLGGSIDDPVAFLTSDSANTLAQRNGTNAQIYRWYHTYTDASNNQYGALRTAAGYVEMAAVSAGTGAANIDVLLTPKGTGAVRFGTHAAVGAETVTGYITIKDAGGTSRKVAVLS